MRELRAVALSEDGGYLVLADASSRSDAEQFRVPVDDRLRAALRGARRSEVRTESALTPREIQARLRAGETAADVARAAGIPVERVERYEGPVLAERARVVQEARAALLPKDTGGAPGRPLGEVVDARLMAGQDNPDSAQWDAWRRVDGIWLVQLTSESRCARWTWDPVVRRVRPHDDAARALVAPEPLDAAPAPAAAAPAPARQGPPALTLVPEPAAGQPAPSRPAPGYASDQRPRYAQPAPFPAGGYQEAHGPAAPFQPAPQEQYPAAQHSGVQHPAAQHPAARFPADQYPAAQYPGEPAQASRDDLGQGAARPSQYPDPAAYPPAQQRPEHVGHARYQTDGYPPADQPVPTHYPAADASRPFPEFAAEPFDADPAGGPLFGEDPFADEPYAPDPYAAPHAGRGAPAGPPTGPTPIAPSYRLPAPEHTGGLPIAPPSGEPETPFAGQAGRPARPAAAHRPTRPPALDLRPTRPLDGRRWPEHDDADLDLALDADLFDEPADHLAPPSPAPARPLPRPATAPPRGTPAPPARPSPVSARPPAAQAQPSTQRTGLPPAPSQRPVPEARPAQPRPVPPPGLETPGTPIARPTPPAPAPQVARQPDPRPAPPSAVPASDARWRAEVVATDESATDASGDQWARQAPVDPSAELGAASRPAAAPPAHEGPSWEAPSHEEFPAAADPAEDDQLDDLPVVAPAAEPVLAAPRVAGPAVVPARPARSPARPAARASEADRPSAAVPTTPAPTPAPAAQVPA
ncbi:septation protein SepH, partial [Frankia sp. AgW1.1]